ncbi:MAG: DUF2155 domain-containing protein [Alphaproteobacteria bacterium]|nr:DUF2155 domain-containing protein [Alphaproteobacteria bacterium]
MWIYSTYLKIPGLRRSSASRNDEVKLDPHPQRFDLGHEDSITLSWQATKLHGYQGIFRYIGYICIALGLFAKESFAYTKDSFNTSPQKSSKTTQMVTLKILDKETGKTQTFKTPLSKPVRYKSIIVRPRSCVKKKAGMAYEVNWSFIEAWIQPSTNRLTVSENENKPETIPIHLIFSSWLNSALPGFFHPNYAIFIHDCNDS